MVTYISCYDYSLIFFQNSHCLYNKGTEIDRGKERGNLSYLEKTRCDTLSEVKATLIYRLTLL